jgi:hypothetical protein
MHLSLLLRMSSKHAPGSSISLVKADLANPLQRQLSSPGSLNARLRYGENIRRKTWRHLT